MDRTVVQEWLDRYVAAWEAYDPDAIGALFSADATYRYHPYDEGDDVLQGRDAIVRSWIAPDGALGRRARVRQRVPAPIRRGGPLFGVHGVLHAAQDDRLSGRHRAQRTRRR